MLRLQDSMSVLMDRVMRLESEASHDSPVDRTLLDGDDESETDPALTNRKTVRVETKRSAKQPRLQSRIGRLTMTPRDHRAIRPEREGVTRDTAQVRFMPVTKWPTFSGNPGEDPVHFLTEFEEIMGLEERSDTAKLTFLARCLR